MIRSNLLTHEDIIKLCTTLVVIRYEKKNIFQIDRVLIFWTSKFVKSMIDLSVFGNNSTNARSIIGNGENPSLNFSAVLKFRSRPID